MKYIISLSLLIFVTACSQDLDASYEGGENLIMTDRDTKTNEDKIIFDLSVPLYAIYWNSSNNQYYYVKDGSDLTKTNGLRYRLNSKKAEQVLTKDVQDLYLNFAGYISSNERLYIHKTTKQQYIKTLIPIHDPIEVIPNRKTYLDGMFSCTMYEEDPNYECEAFPRSPRTGNLPLGGLPF